jgi:tetrahydromethanopterin S-methyltransferase subunit H
MSRGTQQYIDIASEVSGRPFEVDASEGARVRWHAVNVENARSPVRVREQALYEITFRDVRNGFAVEDAPSVLYVAVER